MNSANAFLPADLGECKSSIVLRRKDGDVEGIAVSTRNIAFGDALP